MAEFSWLLQIRFYQTSSRRDEDRNLVFRNPDYSDYEAKYPIKKLGQLFPDRVDEFETDTDFEPDDLDEVLNGPIRSIGYFYSGDVRTADVPFSGYSYREYEITFDYSKLATDSRGVLLNTTDPNYFSKFRKIIDDIKDVVQETISSAEIYPSVSTKFPDLPKKPNIKILADEDDSTVNTFVNSKGGYRLEYELVSLEKPTPTSTGLTPSVVPTGASPSIAPVGLTPSGATPSGATPSGATPSVPQELKTQQENEKKNTVEQDKSRGEVKGQEQNTTTPKSGSPVNFIAQVTQTRIKPTQISMQIGGDQGLKEEMLKNLGIAPIVYYNNLQIEYKDVDYLRLYISNNLPCLQLVFYDTFGTMKDQNFPLDDSKITVFMSSKTEQLKSVHMDFKIRKFHVTGKAYTIEGIIDVNELFIRKYKSFQKKTSFYTLQDIANEIGLGFATNIDNTNDAMTWINPGKTYNRMIMEITNAAYKSDETYLVSYIDFFYNLVYVDVEKELRRDLKQELGIGNTGLEDMYKKSPDFVSQFMLTNDLGFRSTNMFFKSHSVINKSSSVSLREGYFTKVKYYDAIQKDFLVFDVDSLTYDEKNKIILKGKPGDENFKKQKFDLVYKGKLDLDNMYPNYQYSQVQNNRNLVDLKKIGLQVIMANPNFNLYRFKKVFLTLSRQAPSVINSEVNSRLSGEWLIVDIEYQVDRGSFVQVVQLVKRELDLSPDEFQNEVNETQNKRDDTRGKSSNPSEQENPSTPTQQTPANSTQPSAVDTAKPESEYNEDDINVTVPPPPQHVDGKNTLSSPRKFKVLPNSFIKKERKPNQFLLHYSAGAQANTPEGTILTLMTRTNAKGEVTPLSYHYIIDIKGGIENLVDPKYIAQHSGTPINDYSIGISLLSYGVYFDTDGYRKLGVKTPADADKIGIQPLKDQAKQYPRGYQAIIEGNLNENHVLLVDYDGKPKPYRGFRFAQEVSVAQIAALRKLMVELKRKFPTLPSWSGMTREQFDIIFPPSGTKKGLYGAPTWNTTTNIFAHGTITEGKNDIVPTPRLVEFLKTLRL